LGANAVGIDCWWELFLVWSDYCFTNNFLYLNYLKCQNRLLGIDVKTFSEIQIRILDPEA
jgi:hypothetical protein